MAVELFESLNSNDRLRLLEWLNQPECQLFKDQIQLLALKTWNELKAEVLTSDHRDFEQVKKAIETLEKLSDLIDDMATPQYQFVQLKRP